ncbi:TPA: hypothetical protein ENS27_03190 [bacterium]|nr:hypothetical protein [bacterium]
MKTITIFSFSLIFIPSLLFVFSTKESTQIKPVYPDSQWQKIHPKNAGMSQDMLYNFSDTVGGRGCVIRYGYIIHEWGDQSRRADVASAVKPIYSHFLFKALEDNMIESLDEPVVKYESQLKDINRDLNYKDTKITWRHLANQTSCYGVNENPGTAFDYNDWQMALFCDLLFLKVYKTSWDKVDSDVLHPKLTDLIQCQDNPSLIAFGSFDRAGRMAISVRDFARIGLLYLRKGNWKGIQIISEEHAKMAISEPVANSIPRTLGIEAEMIGGQRSIGSRQIPDNQGDHFGSYSWLWWINGLDSNKKRMWHDAPSDTFGAFGHGGIRGMFVIPSLDIVVSYNEAENLEGWLNGNESPLNNAMRMLANSVINK